LMLCYACSRLVKKVQEGQSEVMLHFAPRGWKFKSFLPDHSLTLAADNLQ
jgi:hypothetical protein